MSYCYLVRFVISRFLFVMASSGLVSYSSGEEENNEYGGSVKSDDNNRNDDLSGGKRDDVNYDDVKMDMSSDGGEDDDNKHADCTTEKDFFASKEDHDAYKEQFAATKANKMKDASNIPSEYGSTQQVSSRFNSEKSIEDDNFDRKQTTERSKPPDSDVKIRQKLLSLSQKDEADALSLSSVAEEICLSRAESDKKSCFSPSDQNRSDDDDRKIRKSSRSRSRSRDKERRRKRSRSGESDRRRHRSRSRSRDRRSNHRHRRHKHKDHYSRCSKREREWRDADERSRDRPGEKTIRKLEVLGMRSTVEAINTATAAAHAAAAAAVTALGHITVPPVGNTVINTNKHLHEAVTQKIPSLMTPELEAQVFNAKQVQAMELPAYYNPNTVNASKIASISRKRQMLWGSKKAEPSSESGKEPLPAAKSSSQSSFNKWENTNFGDTSANEKFRRLMGIKGGTTSLPPSAPSDVKTAKLFADQEDQYERARAFTHTQRGLGLGFSDSLVTSDPSNSNKKL